MLSATIANTILNGLFAMGLSRDENGVATSNGKVISFSNDLYLGLLTKIPTAEDESTLEPVDSGDTSYMRIKLNSNNRITKEPFIKEAVIGTQSVNEDGDQIQPIEVVNNGPILFPEAESGYQIVGFGIFTSNDMVNAKVPFLWGELAEPISVEAEEVPIIRDGSNNDGQGFKISLV